VYYTRIATPLSLRSSGYPKEFKFSLLTRERKVAYLRNIEQVQLLHALFDKAKMADLSFSTFKAELSESIDKLRKAYNKQPEATKAPPLSSKPIGSEPKVGEAQLAQFVESKRLESVTALTVKQLNQRCKDFLAYLAEQDADTPSNGHAMAYRDALIQRGLSHKSLKDYLAANRQFFNWCVAKEFISTNPFAVVKVPKKGKSVSRARWKAPELRVLFASKAYKAKGEQFDWITKIQMYQGCRPSEACQLRLQDIRLGDNPSIHFSDAEEKQHLKNASSNRIVPIHKALIEQGLLEYTAQRRQQGATQLFDLTPRGDDLDWSNDYRDAFGDVLDECGFKAGDRATAYSFRHTFIDELQKVGVQEHVVAQIVGHTHQSMTYGHYAKNLDLEILREAVNRFDVSAI